MADRVRRPLRLVLGLLVLAATAAAQGVATRNAKAAARSTLSGKPFPVIFTDVARAAGLEMTFVVGPDNHKDYILEANGTGVALFDYDNDGLLDAYLVNGSRFGPIAKDEEPISRLYHNIGEGRFEDVTARSGTGRHGWGGGVCAGDYDNDGYDDLFVAYWGPNSLYRNRGDGAFADMARAAGVAGPETEWTTGCTFLDYDRDGFLDLFVTSYQQFDPKTAPKPGGSANCEWKGLPVFCGPRGLPFGSVTLYRNRGDGTFEDVSEASGVRKVRGFYAFTPVAADLNGDGWTDIYVASDSTPSLFFRNNKDGTFREIGVETSVAFNEHGYEQGGMGVAVGDYDNDGRLDLIKTNFTGDYPNVYRNLGGGIFEDVVVRAGLAVNPEFVGWGVGLVDLDNDGLKDVFQVNGHVYPEIDRLGIGETWRNPRVVYRNLGNGRFEDVSTLAGPGVAARHSSRGAAFGDFDNDGDIDVLVMNMGEPPSLLRNDYTGANRWILLMLRGTASNRSAIGAVVTIAAGGRRQTGVVLSQSSFLSQNDRRLHFGLGSADRVDSIRVRWPSGEEEEFPEAPAGSLIELVEGSGESRPVPLKR